MFYSDKLDYGFITDHKIIYVNKGDDDRSVDGIRSGAKWHFVARKEKAE